MLPLDRVCTALKPCLREAREHFASLCAKKNPSQVAQAWTRLGVVRELTGTETRHHALDRFLPAAVHCNNLNHSVTDVSTAA